jgi:hypothetical protein
MPGTSCPIHSDCSTHRTPTSSSHVWWPCRRPCAVSPVRSASQEATGTGSAGLCPVPARRAPFILWRTIAPSRRSRMVRPQAGQRPLPSLPASRGMPLPVGGAYGSPGTAGGHGGSGAPGHGALMSTRTGMADRGCGPLRSGYRPSAAGRTIRVAMFDRRKCAPGRTAHRHRHRHRPLADDLRQVLETTTRARRPAH